MGIVSTDGSVIVSHSGAEMGQGMNTKVVQSVAHKLQIPMETIEVEFGDTVRHASGGLTGGSTTTEVVIAVSTTVNYVCLKLCVRFIL